MSPKLSFFSFTLICLALGAQAKSDEKINKYLTSKCDNDFSCNIAAAKDFLAQREKTISQVKIGNEALIKDLKTLISLEQIDSGLEKCNQKSWKILSDNKQLVGGDVGAIAQKNKESTSRIETLVYNTSLKHATACREVYPQKYEEAKKNLDDTMAVTRAETSTSLVRSLKDTLLPWTYDSPVVEAAHKGLVQAATNEQDPLVKYTAAYRDGTHFNSLSYFDLYNKYIRRPCLYLIEKLGEEILEPALFDISLGGSYVDSFTSVIDTYSVCKIISEQTYSKKLSENMIRLASARPKQAKDQ